MPKILLSAHILLAGCKLLLLFYWILSGSASVVGGTSDGDYYHDFAIGLITDDPTSYWPELLNFLNSIDLYQRSVVVYVLVAINITIIPFLSYVLSRRLGAGVVASLVSALFVQALPTNILISSDIYRDNVFVVLALIVALLVAGRLKEYGIILEAFAVAVLAYIGFIFRPYFGFSLFLAYVALIFWSGWRPFRLGLTGWLVVSILVLFFLKSFGMLDSIFKYRGVEGFEVGGSTFGIGFFGKSFLEFYFLYLLNWIYQFFGFYLSDGFLSLGFFALESMPLLLGFWLYRARIPHLGRCGVYILFFTAIYCSIWVMGNDNFGTAIRLRLPVYVLLYSMLGALIFRDRAKPLGGR